MRAAQAEGVTWVSTNLLLFRTLVCDYPPSPFLVAHAQSFSPAVKCMASASCFHEVSIRKMPHNGEYGGSMRMSMLR